MKKETRLVIINILISIWSITEKQPNHLVFKTKARIEPTVMSTQKVSSFSCPGSSCWGNDSYTPLQGRLNSLLKYKDDWQVYLDYQPSSTQAEKPRALWKWHAAVESGPTICPSKVPDAVGVISAAARAIPMVLGGLFCLPWPFGLMVATGQISVGEPKGNILSRTMISGYEGHVIKAPLGDKVFTRQSCVWWHHSSYLFLCDLMCAAIEPAISAAFLFWPK